MQHLTSINWQGVGGTGAPIAKELPKHKSAGLAWLLSLFIPGAGHLYAGLHMRGVLVLGFSLVGMLILILLVASGAPQPAPGTDSGALFALLWTPVIGVPVLWVFGFIDAYSSTVEGNRGIDPTVVDNPRVASVLNLVTGGFGYFYLGERAKGLAIFVGLNVVRVLSAMLPGRLPHMLYTLVVAALVYISIDAYRIGRRAFAAQVASMDVSSASPPSRLPPIVPVIFASAVASIFLFLIALGSLMVLLGVPLPESADRASAPADVRGWQGAEWGMSTDAVVAATEEPLGTTTLDQPADATCYAGPFTQGEFVGTRTLCFAPGRGLQSVKLHIVMVQFPAVFEQLRAKYGTPTSRKHDPANLISETATWLFPATQITCEYMGFDTGTVFVTYQPRKSSGF